MEFHVNKDRYFEMNVIKTYRLNPITKQYYWINNKNENNKKIKINL